MLNELAEATKNYSPRIPIFDMLSSDIIDIYNEIIKKHNDKVRNYWNNRKQSISCRVRVKKENNWNNFRNNIIDFLYNHNIEEFKTKWEEIANNDWNFTQKKLNINKDTPKKEQFNKAMYIRDKEGYGVIDLLELFNVVSTKLIGYYKEFFFLKCYIHRFHPQFVLRILYHINLEKDHFEQDQYEQDQYIEEIRDLFKNYLFINNKSND